MRTKLRGMLRILVCVVAAVILTIPAWAGGEVYVVGANDSGDASYMLYNNGSFAKPEILQLTEDSGIADYQESHGNGLGDFDNDGDYDYITGFGYMGGSIYIFENQGPGNPFGAPMVAAFWNQGRYAEDIAVADFNGDGNQDFVMSYKFSFNSGLYLGDGKLGFTYYLLENTAPFISAGIDAADFNNDGFADFVVAPNSTEKIYVNLSNGEDGINTPLTFTPLTFKSHDGNPVYGIAAADFNNDGNADIATANWDYLIIYTGNGKGAFKWAATYEFDLNQSPIDNYDFDGDGYQDLVAANYGTDGTNSIVVFMNDSDKDDGTLSFSLYATYPGPVDGLVAVSVPPSALKNIEPVAVLDSDYYEVTVGEVITFNGSQSNDDEDDGEIVAYRWDFGDGTTVTEGGRAEETHVYSEAGQYFITLTVTDNNGATAEATAEVHVAAVSSLSVKVAFTPHTLFAPHKLNLNSRGKWITATIWVPDGYDARQIEMDSVQIAMDDGPTISASTDSKYGFFNNLFKRCRSRHSLTVKFDRKTVSDALDGASGAVLLKVIGQLRHDDNLVDFSGEGTLQVIEKHRKRSHHGNKYKHGWK